LLRKFIQTNLNNHTKLVLWILISSVILLFAVKLGSVRIPLSEVIDSLVHHEGTLNRVIIWDIRLPRIILGLLVGGALSASGMALQSLLRNPLAEPYTIGVSSGATLAVVLCIVLPIPFIEAYSYLSNLFALIGSLLALLLVLSIAKWGQRALTTESIVLAGIVLSAFFSSIITLLISLSKNSEMQNILGWMMGSLNGSTWTDVMYVTPVILLGFVYILFRMRTIRAFSDGDASAQSIGVSIAVEKTLLFVAIAMMAGAAVSISGMIGFVGLIVPHFVKRMIRGNNISAYLLSFILGGSYLVTADLVARTIVAPAELPIGVITAIIGAPIFTWILIRQRRGGAL
jgi:iron complex transport system permease protein